MTPGTLLRSVLLGAAAFVAVAGVARADGPSHVVDIAELGSDALLRVFGTTEDGGEKGVPVAGGFDVFPLVAHIARLRSPADAAEFHFGATCQLADLDGNGRSQLLAAATLTRVGAGVMHVFFGRTGAWTAFVDLADGALLAPEPGARTAMIVASAGIAMLAGARGRRSVERA